MTITTAPKIEQDDEPIRANAWINVDFTKDGRHFPFVDVVYDSEGEAKQFADTFALRAEAANEKFLRDYGCCAEITDGCARHLYFGLNTATRSICRRGRHDHRFAHPRRRVSRFLWRLGGVVLEW
jgi:hypothetical protein